MTVTTAVLGLLVLVAGCLQWQLTLMRGVLQGRDERINSLEQRIISLERATVRLAHPHNYPVTPVPSSHTS